MKTSPVSLVEDFAEGRGPELQQDRWRDQRDVMAGGAIDLDEIAPPEILGARQMEGLHSTQSSFTERAPGGFVNGP